MKRGIAIVVLLVSMVGIIVLLTGCPPVIVRVRPPEARVEVYGAPPYPEAVWIPGYWRHYAGEWIWVPGHWDRPPRHGSVWVSGHWEPRGDGWVWIKGHWEYR